MITIISSVQKVNLGMGFENDLLWSIPEDLRRFKNLTMGHPIIMGRRTWGSLPEKYRPLPGRQNIVITSQSEFEAPGAIIVSSIEEAVEKAKELDEEIFIIGGARVFEESLHLADRLILTEIEGEKESDTYFPRFDDLFIKKSEEGPFEHEGIKYWFVNYKKK